MAFFSSTYKKTFDQIIAPISQVIADLDTHAQKNKEASDTKFGQANALLAEAKSHDTEVARAAAAKAKFEALIS